MTTAPESLSGDPVTRPDWLNTRRAQAAERSATFAPPTGREEAWRYTDVSLLAEEIFDPHPPPGPTRMLPESARGHWQRWHDVPAQATLVNGSPVVATLPGEAKEAGVTLLDLDHAAAKQPELLRTHLGSLVGADDLFTAQSLALYQGGLLLHVPRGTRLTEPLRLQHWLAAAGTLIRSRVVVVVEADAEVTLCEDLAGDDLETPSLLMPVVELFVGAGSRVTWQSWQQLGSATRHLAHVAARLERDAELTTFHASFGADFSRTNLTVEHAGQGAVSTLLGAYFPSGDQHQEHWTVQDLKAPHAHSELLYKGALTDAGHSLYYGTIRVGSEARGTDSYQTNRNLLLSDTARADSNPQLEIDTNDVRCSHGSSAGQVDKKQLFYALSRGIPRAEAERMLVLGFLAEVADRLPGDEARERLEHLVRAKLGEARP
jgi:Fe-S cluster assembly protein SufD